MLRQLLNIQITPERHHFQAPIMLRLLLSALLALLSQAAIAQVAVNDLTPFDAPGAATVSDPNIRLFSPDGSVFCMVGAYDGPFGQQDVYCGPSRVDMPLTRVSSSIPQGGAGSVVFVRGSSQVIYSAQHDAPDRSDLYLVPVDGSAAPIRLTSASIPDSSISQIYYNATADTVLFMRFNDHQPWEMRLVELNNPGVEVAVNLPGGTEPTALRRLTPDGSRVVFLTRDESALLSVHTGTGDVITIAGSSLPGLTGNFEISPDGQKLVFRVESGNRSVLYEASPAAGGSSLFTSPTLPSLDPTLEFEIAPDSSAVAFAVPTFSLGGGNAQLDLYAKEFGSAGFGELLVSNVHRCQTGLNCFTVEVAVDPSSQYAVATGRQDPSGTGNYTAYSRRIDRTMGAQQAAGEMQSGRIRFATGEQAIIAQRFSNLYLGPLDGSGLTWLTQGIPGDKFYAAYSASAQRVIVYSDEGAMQNYYSVALSGDPALTIALTGGGLTSAGQCMPLLGQLTADGHHYLVCDESRLFLPPATILTTKSLRFMNVGNGRSLPAYSISYSSADVELPVIDENYRVSPDHPDLFEFRAYDAGDPVEKVLMAVIDVIYEDGFGIPD